MTHSGEKPFGCAYCDKKFIFSNQKKEHERIVILKQILPYDYIFSIFLNFTCWIKLIYDETSETKFNLTHKN